MDDIRILFYNDDNNENKSKDYFNRINNNLTNDGFEDLMMINDNNSKIIIKIKTKNEMVRELFVLNNSEDNFIMLIISGKVDLNKITKLAGDIDFTELKDLKGYSPFENK